VNQELRRALRNKTETVCIFFDVDSFKKINDEHGYDVGDEVLKLIADSLSVDKHVMRDVDILGRWGGDEFAVILPDTNGQQAERIAHRIEDSVSKIRVVSPKGKTIDVSVSTGIGSITADRIQIDFSKIIDDLVVKRSSRQMQENKKAKKKVK